MTSFSCLQLLVSCQCFDALDSIGQHLREINLLILSMTSRQMKMLVDTHLVHYLHQNIAFGLQRFLYGSPYVNMIWQQARSRLWQQYEVRNMQEVWRLATSSKFTPGSTLGM